MIGTNSELFLWMVKAWHVLQIVKAYFRYTTWVIISEKIVKKYEFLCVVLAWQLKFQQDTRINCAQEFLILPVFKLPPCGLVVFIDMNTYRYDIYGRQKFQNILERKWCSYFGTAYGRFYIVIKSILNIEFNIMLIVLMEFCIH